MTDAVTISRETLQAAVDALECALSDSRPYIVKSREVSTTLRAALAAQPAPAPLTMVQIAKALAGAGLKPEDYREDGQIEPLVRAVERAHGIGDKK